MKTLALVVPCYNEQDVLPLFYEQTGKVVSALSENYRTEYVFVDDGSSDRTLEILKDLAQQDVNVKYISFSRNFGKEAAMLAGMAYAVKADYIGILDADLQHSPELIPEMLDYVENQGFDVAAAKRADRKGEAKLKSFLSGSFYKVINKISTTKISESAQDFRIMKNEVVRSILSMPESIRFSKGIFSWVGFKVMWIEHENRERAAGQTKWSLTKLLKYAIDGILGFTDTPLKLSFVSAGAFFLFALAGLLYGIIKNAVVAEYQPMLPFILAALFFVAGVLFVTLGIMGEYLARTYTEVKRRPKFIISQTNIRQNPYSEN